jgi:hypothetical protein
MTSELLKTAENAFEDYVVTKYRFVIEHTEQHIKDAMTKGQNNIVFVKSKESKCMPNAHFAWFKRYWKTKGFRVSPHRYSEDILCISWTEYPKWPEEDDDDQDEAVDDVDEEEEDEEEGDADK